MEVVRNQQSEAQAAQAHHGGPHQNKEKDKLRPTEKPNTPSDSSKPLSISLLDKKMEPKEIVDAFTERLSKAQLNTSPSSNPALQEKFHGALDTMFKEEGPQKFQDQVVIRSSAAGVSANIAVKPKRDQEEIKKTGDTLWAAAGDSPGQGTDRIAPDGKAISTTSNLPVSNTQELIKDTFKKYLSAFSETLIQENPQKSDEARQLATTLKTLGVSQEVIKQAQQNTERFVKNDLRQQLKQGFISLALAYGQQKKMSPDMVVQSKKYEHLNNLGKNLGLLDDPIDQDNLKSDAKDELRSVISDELDQALIEKKINYRSPHELVKAFNQFNSLANISKFEPGEYIKKLNTKLENLGLNYFTSPQPQGQLDTDTGSGNRQKGQEERINEIESMEDQLRNLFMAQLLKRDLKSAFTTRYHIFRLKNELKKCGGLDETTLSRLEEEGRALAKIKLLDLLRESFEERATLAELTGPAYGLVKKKTKSALAGLKILRAAPTKDEMAAIRDQVNKGIFTIVKEEYIKVEVFIEANPKQPSLLQKRKEYLAILKRLKEESKIIEEIRPKQFKDMPLLSETKVVEAA